METVDSVIILKALKEMETGGFSQCRAADAVVEFYGEILKDAKEKYGATIGCRGCQAVIRGGAPRPHNERCRADEEKKIQEKEPERFNAALENMVGCMEKKKRKVEEKAEESPTDSNEHIQNSSSSNIGEGGGQPKQEERRKRKELDDVPLGKTRQEGWSVKRELRKEVLRKEEAKFRGQRGRPKEELSRRWPLMKLAKENGRRRKTSSEKRKSNS